MSFRDVLPASLQEIVQNGLLDAAFEDPLLPILLYDRLAEIKPWGAQMGAESIMTRSGLMEVTTDPITGQDATAGTYGFEQYSMKMDQYGKSIDTNMAMSAMALRSKFLQDNKTLGTNAAQTMNLLARNALYNAYGSSNVWVTADAAEGATELELNTVLGFQTAVANLPTTRTGAAEGYKAAGVPNRTPVSGSAPIPVKIGTAGTANTVTGVTLATKKVTLKTALAAAATVGDPVVNTTYGPVSYRPGSALTANQLTADNIATLALFTSAVTRLRKMNVPTLNGAYQAHVDPVTVEELQQTQDWLYAFRGRGDSPAWTDFKIGANLGDNVEFMGRFLGIDWWMNTLTPTVTPPSGVPVYRPIVAGKGSLIKGPFSEMADLVNELNAGSTVQIDLVNGVARILRAPLDRLGQVLTSTWSWIGGFSVGTDLLTGDSAIYKRAVVVEHA